MGPHLLPEKRLLHSLLRLHGRSPAGFSATFLPDGSVSVVGPHGAAFYPEAAWTSRFLRHLRLGYFDAVRAGERPATA